MHIRTFISYRNIASSRNTAKLLARALEAIESPTIEVFLDQNDLKTHGGLAWATTLYDNIHKSDVLIVLIDDGTAESNWVQREVDTARGANVAILALAITDSQESVQQAVQDLAIDHLQYMTLEIGDGLHENILNSIIRLSKQTREEQANWFDMMARSRRLEPIVVQNPAHAIYQLEGVKDACPVYLATGDATEMAVDVLVNTENDFMQMARYFESSTLSATIRRKGALVSDEGYLQRDTVQAMLNNQIDFSIGYQGRPILAESVIITTAGHPDSELAQQGVRYIFHAATVKIDRDNQRVEPISLKGITRAVVKCLKKVEEVDRNEGHVIFEEDGSLRRLREEEDAPHRPIHTIILPLFGAGQGGFSTEESIKAMVSGIKDFLKRPAKKHGHQLERISLCVYDQRDASIAERIFQDSGFILM